MISSSTPQFGTLFLVLGTLFGLVLMPTGFVFGYSTTNQEVVAFTETTTLYTITYAFGHGNHDLHLPILATNNTDEREKNDRVVYSITDADGNKAPGTMSSIVLGNVPVKDGMYVIPKGKKATFTLLVLYTHPSPLGNETYDLQVNSLPFSFDGTKQLGLNQGELKYYTTIRASIE